MRKGQARVPNETELKKLRRAVKKGRHGVRDLAIIDVSFYLGLRVAEIANLKYDEIVDQDGVIRDSAVIVGKGGKARTIYLSNENLRSSLEDYLKVRSEGGSYFFNSQKDHFTSDGLQVHFNRLYKKAKLDGCSSHSGRRHFATKLLEAGVDIKAVSTLMGHSDISTTARYVQDNPDRLANAVANL